MLTSDQEDLVHAATRLMYFGQQPKKRPRHDGEYSRLIDAYFATPELRRLLERVVAAMEFKLLNVSPDEGVVLVPFQASLFAMTLTDLRQRLKNEDKAALGMAMLAVAATFFPTGESLDDPEPPSQPSRIIDFIDTLIRLAHSIRDGSGEDMAHLGGAAGYIVSLPQHNDPGGTTDRSERTDRARLGSLEGLIRLVTNYWEDEHLLRPFKIEGAGQDYIATQRLKMMLRDAASDPVLALVWNMPEDTDDDAVSALAAAPLGQE